MASLFPSDYSWAPGDVIALINGSHVSTGHMYSVLDEFIRLYAEVIAVNCSCGVDAGMSHPSLRWLFVMHILYSKPERKLL